jgi:hypothetical protein
LIVLAASLGFSQSRRASEDSLDSLLLEGDFTAFLMTWEGLSGSAEKKEISQEAEAGYVVLAKNLRQISTAGEGKVRELCELFAEAYSAHSMRHSGEKANVMSQKFLTAADQQRYSEALQYHYAGRYFTDKHIQSGKKRLWNIYRMIEESFSRGQYDEVIRKAAVFEMEDPSNPAFAGLQDTLARLVSQMKLNAKKRKGEIELRSEHNRVTKQLTLSVGLGFISYRETEDQRMVLRHRTYSDLDSYIGLFSQESHSIQRLQLEYFIDNSFALGLKVAAGTIYSSAVHALEGEKVDRIEKFYSIGASGKYFLGGGLFIVSPYVGFEAGIMSIERNKVQLNPSSFWYSEYHAIDRIKENYPQISVEVGVEYNFGTRSPCYVGVDVFLSNNFADERLIPHLNLGVGMRIGVNLR